MASILMLPNPMRANQIARARARMNQESIPMAVAAVMRRIMTQTELRAFPAEAVAMKLSTPVPIVLHAIAQLVATARQQAGQPVPTSAILQRLSAASSFDQALAAFGSIAAPSTTNVGPSDYGNAGAPPHGHHRRGRGHFGGRGGWGGTTIVEEPYWVLAPSVLDSCLSYLPPELRQSQAVRRMLYLARTGAIEGRTGNAGAISPDAKATDPDYQWRWTVQTGDNPSIIAKKITGDDRRYVELIAANPSKPTKGSASSPYTTGYNFATLTTGEKLLIPKAWNVYIASDGSGYTGGKVLPAGSAPSSPTTTTTSTSSGYGSSLPKGQITAIKLQLGAFGTKEGVLYGYPGLYDTNDVIDESFLNAVRTFQNWSNTNRGTSLRIDGLLDADTHAALNAYTSGSGGTTTTPTTPSTATTSPGLPALPGGGTPASSSAPSSSSGSSSSSGAGPIVAILGVVGLKIAGVI